jgi:hypothetical protein
VHIEQYIITDHCIPVCLCPVCVCSQSIYNTKKKQEEDLYSTLLSAENIIERQVVASEECKYNVVYTVCCLCECE